MIAGRGPDLACYRRAASVSNVDQFESAFRAASKTLFAFAPIPLRRVTVICDRDREFAEAFTRDLIRALAAVIPAESEWSTLCAEDYDNVDELLRACEQSAPDLVCTYRQLDGAGWKYAQSLGLYVDVLTQTTPHPVLLLPHPEHEAPSAPARLARVMAITDTLTGSDHLVSAAACLTPPGGTLWLAHVEDEQVFEHYMQVIGKIPTIDTEHARLTIAERLLKEPRDYVISCREGLSSAGVELRIEDAVTLGQRLDAYERLVVEHEIDMLVMNTKDDDQMAMHGMAYPLAVELHSLPLLLL
jgi:hypothetical protein